MLLGRPLGNRARLDFGALAECKLLAACVCIWLGHPDARRLVRRAAYQRHTDHGGPALDDPGSTSAAKRHMGYRHSMATYISPGKFHLASLMLENAATGIRYGFHRNRAAVGRGRVSCLHPHPVRADDLEHPEAGRTRLGTESLQTRRWREADSNHRFPQAREVFDASAYLRAAPTNPARLSNRRSSRTAPARARN